MSEDEILQLHILQCSYAALKLGQCSLDRKGQELFDAYKMRRLAGEPLQYILGSWEFYGFNFKVSPAVLVPRPETEILVEKAIKTFKGTRILELGTGSGNIAVTLAKFLPKTKIDTLDVSGQAQAIAKENANAHGVLGQINFILSDMRVWLVHENPQAPYDLIISNPPYIKHADLTKLPLDVQQEPRLALDGGPQGFDFYEVIIKNSPRLLRGGGWLMMEFGDGQENMIKAMIEAQAAFSSVEIIHDLNDRARVIKCQKE